MARLFTFIAFGAMLWPSLGAEPAVSRQLSNVVGSEDGRRSLVSHFQKFKLLANEAAEIRAAVGYVNCGQEDAWVTAFLVAPDVVVTVAHIFYEANGLPIASRENCFFRTQGDRAGVKYSISGRPDDVVVGSDRPLENRTRDWAVARLNQPVAGGSSLRVLSRPIDLTEWTEVTPISAYRAKKYRLTGESANEPIAQICYVRRFVEAEFFYSDCDITVGGSGSPVLVRLEDGTLAAAGMFVAAGKAADNTPYLDEGSTKSLSVSVTMDGPFLLSIRNFVHRSILSHAQSTTSFIK